MRHTPQVCRAFPANARSIKSRSSFRSTCCRAGAEIEHHEVLFTDITSSDAALIEALQRTLPASGSIVTWNNSFEKTINKCLAERNPVTATFFESMNTRAVNLQDVFTSQGYHPDQGCVPVLAPGRSYKDREIRESGTASDTWNKIVTGQLDAGEVRKSEETCSRIVGSIRAQCGRSGAF